MSNHHRLTPLETAVLAANLAEEKKAKDTLVLDTEQISTVSDYFVIASVESRPQMQALADHLIKSLKAHQLQPLGQEVDKSGHWTVLDYGDIVIHLFYPEDRAYYQLERFWSHATEIPRHLWLRDQRQAS